MILIIYSIVVTNDAMQWLEKCLGSLVDSTVSTKIIVVDNQSTDGTPDKIRALFPLIELIEPRQNLGFGKANNIGLSRALEEGADYVFLLNQDAWVEKDTIDKLLSIKNPEFAILSPMHFNGQGNLLDVKFANYLLSTLTPESISDIILNRFKTLYETPYVNAAAWLLNMKCVEIIGGFDPTFFMYGEDDNYVLRVKYYGYKIGICPLAKIYHDRQFRDNTKWDGLYAMKKNSMIYLKDLNKSFLNRFVTFILTQSITTLKDMFHLRFHSIFIDILSIFYVSVSLRKIIDSRLKAKKPCAFLKNDKIYTRCDP